MKSRLRCKPKGVFQAGTDPIMRWLLRLRCKLDITGLEKLRGVEGALLISNHVSVIDPATIASALDRPVRFLMPGAFFETSKLKGMAGAFECVAVPEDDSDDAFHELAEDLVRALRRGELICVFPEVHMTRTGHLGALRCDSDLRTYVRGTPGESQTTLISLAQQAGVPVVPVHLDRLWGSRFSASRLDRTHVFGSKSMRRTIAVTLGKPLGHGADCATIRQALTELGVEAFSKRKQEQRPLHVQFWRTAKRYWRRQCMADSTGRALTWGKTLAAARTLSRVIKLRCAQDKMVGVMLPPTVAAALVNVATLLVGKVPVNINFTGSQTNIDTVMRKCSLKTVFTSRRLLKKMSKDADASTQESDDSDTGAPERPEYVYLEDVMASIPKHSLALNWLLAAIVPSFLAERCLMHRGEMDALATVSFTSGSTGEPKGVMLTHHNVMSNVEALFEVLQFGPEDTIMGVLPPFHSFGFTAPLWGPLTSGMSVVFHPNPLDAKGVGRMVEKHRATILLATPSFCALYVRGCNPEQFRSLRLAIAGGQKLQPEVARAFEEKFGCPLSEGYGCTETSPVVSLNIHDVHQNHMTHVGTRPGSVGRVLPGVAVRAVNRNTLAPVKHNTPGMLLVKGHNVMLGYLDEPETTAKTIRDGWYTTADIGRLDEDGFVHIHDRISRFSKIAGEMVAHGAVENALQKVVASEDTCFVVVSLPDPVRGEKLVALYSSPELDPGALISKAIAMGTPSLWLPSPKSFIRLATLPLLASGKTDLAAARRIAASNQSLT